MAREQTFPRTEIVSAEPEGRRVVIRWGDDHESRFHAIWLRYGCTCAECGNTASAIRRLRLTDIPPDIAAAAVLDPRGHLRLTWASDGHVSEYDPAWLRAHCYSAPERARRRFRPVLWGPELAEEVPQSDYAKVRADEAERLGMLERLRDYGFVRLRGVPAAAEETEKVAALVGLLRETNYGRVYDLVVKPSPLILGDTGAGLMPHTDEPYRHWPPGITFFHCLAASADGGASIFVDSFRIAEELRAEAPEAFYLLSHAPQRFYRLLDEERDFRTEGRIFSLDFEGNVTGFRLLDRGAAALDLPEPMIEPYFAALRKLLERLYREDQHLHLRLVPGDVLIFNNQRVLHGRTAFDPTKARRHIRSCHVDIDEFHSTLRLLCRRFGRDEAEVTLPAGAAA